MWTQTHTHTHTAVWSPVSSCDTGLFLEQSYVYCQDQTTKTNTHTHTHVHKHTLLFTIKPHKSAKKDTYKHYNTLQWAEIFN